MVAFLVYVINLVIQVIMILVIVKVILSYFMSPYQPLRMAIDRVVEPMLAPIRRVVPPLGGLDFTPIVFIILLSLIGRVLVQFLLAIS
jgi:YggT family protein